MKRLLYGTFALLILLMLCGCWDIKDIRNNNYVVSVGIDYVKDQYDIYLKMVDFSTIAKSEGGGGGNGKGSSDVWIGKGSAKTLDMAFYNLSLTMQQRTILSYISTLIVSENALKQKGALFFWDTFSRFQEPRLTPWIFGTKDPIDQLLTTPAFFSDTRTITLLEDPTGEYKQRSNIKPMMLNHYGAMITEPASTVLLPSVTITSDAWKHDQKPDPKVRIDGAFALSQDQLKGWFSANQNRGLRWMESSNERSPIAISRDGKDIAVVTARTQKVKIHPSLKQNLPSYQIELAIKGALLEVHDDITAAEIEKIAAATVEQEVWNTYKNGLKQKADVLGLEHKWFKAYPQNWKAQHGADESHLNSQSLDKVTVRFILDSTGMNTLTQK